MSRHIDKINQPTAIQIAGWNENLFLILHVTSHQGLVGVWGSIITMAGVYLGNAEAINERKAKLQTAANWTWCSFFCSW